MPGGEGAELSDQDSEDEDLLHMQDTDRGVCVGVCVRVLVCVPELMQIRR